MEIKMPKVYGSGLMQGNMPIKYAKQTLKTLSLNPQYKEGRSDGAASLIISRKGSELARKLRRGDKSSYRATSTLENKREHVDEIILGVNRGNELTDDDKEFLEAELQKVAAATYAEKRNHFVTKEDVESVLFVLKENYEKRLRIYIDMQDEVDANMAKDKESADITKLATAKLEEEQEKRIIELLQECLADEDVDISDEAVMENSQSEKEDFTLVSLTPEENSNEENDTGMDTLVAQALKIIENNSKAISQINDRATSELGKVEDYNRLMDREFLKVSDILQSDSSDINEKLYEYAKYKDYMQEYSFNKLVAQVKGQFDMETYLVSKIEFSSHDDLEDLLHRTQNQNAVKQLKMVLDYLT